jgi:hypothetical protein
MRSKLLLNALIVGVVTLAVLLCRMSDAAEWHVIDLDGVYVNYKQFMPGGRDPLVTENGLGHHMDKELNLHFDSTILKYGYWNNMVHSMTDEDVNGHGQFRVVGWNFQLGAHLCKYLDVQYEHYSQHLMDAQLPYGFPVQDSVGIVLHLYRSPASGN